MFNGVSSSVCRRNNWMPAEMQDGQALLVVCTAGDETVDQFIKAEGNVNIVCAVPSLTVSHCMCLIRNQETVCNCCTNWNH